MTYPVVKQGYGSYGYFLQEVGAILGYGRNFDTWNREKQGVADAVIQRGVRAFYTPVPLEGETYGHEWSFLRPVRQLVTEADVYQYDLPADFAMLDGPITFAADQSILYQPIQVVSEYEVRKRQQDTDTTGRPTLAALVPKEARGWQIHFWVTPDSAYTLDYVCKINPLELSEANPWPYGGTEHAQTILESCLKCAEEEKQVAQGQHAGEFLKRLAASVSQDRRRMCPRSLGLNRDRSGCWYKDKRELDTAITMYDSQEWE